MARVGLPGPPQGADGAAGVRAAAPIVMSNYAAGSLITNCPSFTGPYAISPSSF